MKTLSISIIGAVLWAAINAQATLSPISAFREVSISGNAAGNTYSNSVSSSELGLFNESLSDSAVGSDSEGSIYYASSRSSQTSLIFEDLVSLSFDFLANESIAWTFPASLRGPVTANARTTFDLTFAITEPTALSIVGSGFRTAASINYAPFFDLQINSASDGSIFDSETFQIDKLIPVAPGTYTMHLASSGFAAQDPLGSLSGLQANIRLTTVPESGSSLLLMLGGFLFLIFGNAKLLAKLSSKA